AAHVRSSEWLFVPVNLRPFPATAGPDNGDNDLRADVAAQQERVGAVELRRSDELLEADLGSVQVRGEEDGALVAATGGSGRCGLLPEQRAHQYVASRSSTSCHHCLRSPILARIRQARLFGSASMTASR